MTAEAFKPLTEEEETEVNRALSNSSRYELMLSLFAFKWLHIGPFYVLLSFHFYSVVYVQEEAFGDP